MGEEAGSLFDAPAKSKVKDEFAEKDKKKKEEEKIVITPAVLPKKPESESESEEEEEKPEPKKKLSKADLKPAVQIKIAAAPEPPISRRKKKEPEPEPAGSLFDDLPAVKPKVKDEFTEKEKKPKEEEKIIITPAVLPEKPQKETEQIRSKTSCSDKNGCSSRTTYFSKKEEGT